MKPRINPFEKRKKEFARKERQKKKAERREERERERAERPATGPDEDPDIAGIVPGPQPPLDIDLDDPLAYVAGPAGHRMRRWRSRR